MISVRLTILFAFLLSQTNVATGEITVEAVYDLLSYKLHGLVNRIGNLETQMTTVLEKIEKIEEIGMPATYSEETGLSLKDRTQLELIDKHADTIHKMLADEKKILRESVTKMESKFADLKEEVTDNAKEIGKMFDEFKDEVRGNVIEIGKGFDEFKRVINSSIEEGAFEIAELKADINSSTSELSYSLHIITESLENSTKASLTALEKNLQSATDAKINSLSSRVSSLSSSLSSRISSESSSLYSRISSESSSLSSRLSSTSSSLSSLSSRVSSLSSDMSSLSSRLSDEEATTVGFTAHFDPADSYYNPRETVRFQKVYYNEGDGYSSSTGIFTAPKSGTYLFIFTVGATDKDKTHAALVVNGYVRAEAMAEKGYRNCGSNAAVVYVYSGQQAYVRTASQQSKYYIASYRTQFTGVLID